MGPMTNISIVNSFLPHTDPEASLAFYGELLGFEVRLDVGYEDLRWITIGAPGQDASIVLYPPTGDPNISPDEQRVIAEMLAKGTFASIQLETDDLEGDFARVEAAGVDIIQEPMDQEWGARDCAFRDPAGNTVRLRQAQGA